MGWAWVGDGEEMGVVGGRDWPRRSCDRCAVVFIFQSDYMDRKYNFIKELDKNAQK